MSGSSRSCTGPSASVSAPTTAPRTDGPADRFNQFECVVEAWWQTWVRLVGETGLAFERTLVFQDPRVLTGHVQRGIIVLGAILFLTGVLLRERR